MCETSFDADLPEEIDLDRDSGTLDEILSGNFLSVECPSCGAMLKPELRIRLVSKKRDLDFVALPELERISLYRGAVELPKGASALVGYHELYERALILADGLDPEAIEIIKYWLIQKAAEQSPDAEIGAAYAGKKDSKLAFHLSGLREGQVAILPVEVSTYEKTLADKPRSLREAPFDRMLKGPYKSVRALEAED
jgi:hypothetical protein